MEWLEDHPLFGREELYEIGNLIREKRKARNWTQNDLADNLNTDRALVSRHENGTKMDLESLVKYSLVFNCPISELLPQKYRRGKPQGLSGRMLEVLQLIAAFPVETQDTIADMMVGAVKLATPAA